jgi:glycogen(starch) synthase
MRPLSVVMLSWEYPPWVVGGLGRHVHALAHALAGQGNRVTVYARGPEGTREDGGVQVFRTQPIPPGIGFRDLVPWSMALNLGLLRGAAADLAGTQPDVIHAHDWLVAPAALALGNLLGVPVVATIHATEHGRHGGRLEGPVRGFVHGIERWLVAEADRLITCSAFMRDEVRRVFGPPDTVVETIPNQVDLAEFGPAGSTAKHDRPTLLFAGRLEHEKGVQTLLRALPYVARRLPWVRLRVVGRGTYAKELRGLAAGLGVLGRARFDGWVDAGRLRELYTSSDAVVVPSVYEPFGLVALEAMACGVPVVAADTGGLRELVQDEVTGLRFPPGEPQVLANALIRVLTDRDLARALGRAGRALVAGRETWAGAAARTAQVYRLTLRERERVAIPVPQSARP